MCAFNKVTRLHKTCRPCPSAFGDPALTGGRLLPAAAARRWGVRLFALDAYLHAASAQAPRVDAASTVRFLRDGVTRVRTQAATQPYAMQALVRMPWRTGACANVFVCRAADAPNAPHGPPFWEVVGMPLAIALASLLIAMAPVMRRIRRLTLQAHAAGEAGVASGVQTTGSDEIAVLGPRVCGGAVAHRRPRARAPQS